MQTTISSANSGATVTKFKEQFNNYDPSPETIESVWRRLYVSPPDDVSATSHPRPFVLAILYMLHVERFLSKRPTGDGGLSGEIKLKRRNLLKRFDTWIPCLCGASCGREWNFINDQGLRAIFGEESKECRIARLVRRKPFNDRSEWKSEASRYGEELKVWDKMFKMWKSGQGSSDTFSRTP